MGFCSRAKRGIRFHPHLTSPIKGEELEGWLLYFPSRGWNFSILLLLGERELERDQAMLTFDSFVSMLEALWPGKESIPCS